MGKVNQGILDGFNGKVGTVVGYYWKSKPVMRGYRRFMRDRHSEAQLIVRLRFATLNELASAFHAATLVGLKNRAKAHSNTEGNNFLQLNWDAVQANSSAEVTIDYASLQLATGSLPPVLFGTAQFDSPQAVNVAFNPASDLPGTSDDDQVYLFVYNPVAKLGILGNAASRTSRLASASLPASWTGDNVHVWGLVAGGGLDNNGRTASSIYLGQGEVA